jgi:hypothetical protein
MLHVYMGHELEEAMSGPSPRIYACDGWAGPAIARIN